MLWLGYRVSFLDVFSRLAVVYVAHTVAVKKTSRIFVGVCCIYAARNVYKRSTYMLRTVMFLNIE